MKFNLLLKISFLAVFFFMEVALTYSNNSDAKSDLLAELSMEFPKEYNLLINEVSEYEGMEQAERTIRQFINKYKINGASVGIVKDGRLVYAKGFGYSNKEEGLEVQPFHQFRIASISKLVTATAIMKLVEEGKFSLESKVFGEHGILQDPLYNVNYARLKDINVEHLLLHTAGFTSRSYGDPMFQSLAIASRMKMPAPATEEAIIKFVLSKNIPYTPGTRYEYSNFGYFILGKIIENASGLSYEEYVKREILEPLHIFDMQIGHNLYEERAENEVKYYDHVGAAPRLSCYGTGKLVPRQYGGSDITILGGAGAWISTPASLLRLLMAIDGEGTKPDILLPETIQTMVTVCEIGEAVIGWKACKVDKWVRTGTLIGTNAVLAKGANGISYAFITNTNVWSGAYFNKEIERMMDQVVANIDYWPNHDLFEEYNTVMEMVTVSNDPKISEIY
jgi:CubicO group peptidase (beta-lactamase class C family)